MKTCPADEIKRLGNGLVVVKAHTMKSAMYEAFVAVFGSKPDYCNTSECLQIKDHHYFNPPAYIFYRVSKSGNWYYGEHIVDDTVDEARYFSFGRWRLDQVNTGDSDIKRINHQIE